jgi:hypothetical protein
MFNSGYTIRRKDGDLSRHIGSRSSIFAGFYEGYGFREINTENKFILDFSSAFDHITTNT